MRICVLGATRAVRPDGGAGCPVDLGSRKPRAVLAALALVPGRPVPADRMADLVWAGEPPRAAHGALHAYLSGIRTALEPDRAARGAGSVVETTDHGYVLRVAAADVDTHAFADGVAAAERELAPLASQFDGGGTGGWPERDRAVRLVDCLDTALGTWSGTPYADLPEHPDVCAARAGLDRLRTAAEEARLLGLLTLGEHVGVLSATETVTAAHPLRERLWALHALALARAGRQGEALDALRRVRELLADELGLDPGAELRALEQGILHQAAWLEPALPTPVTAVAAGERRPEEVSERPAPVRPDAPVGRDGERALLHGLLTDAAAGVPTAAHVVGEAGIGKSRLVEDLVDTARSAGFAVGVGRCSQDDGAPPLWPWLAVLHDLGHELPTPADTDTDGPGRAAFAVRERIAAAVLDAAGSAPVLVVLDDLHWADDATLRALAHLLATLPPSRVCVVGTRRPHPEPAGTLAHVAEAFARRHATRLDLGGLDRVGTARLLDAIGRSDVPAPVVDSWHRRAEGNPFFLVELARLGADHAGDVPATVRDVVTRRLEQLPTRAQDTLRTAAVAGRTFLAETVAAAADADPDDVADDLDVAVAAGLVLDHGDRMAFSHALARDAVHLTLPPSRRARRHARVAHALDTDDVLARLLPLRERVADLALHWLAAGPTHAARAWRAAAAAAAQARELADYREAARMGREAVAASRRAGAGDEERFALLLTVARDAAHAARWTEVVDAAFEAIALGRAMGRPDRVAIAATTISQYAVWTPHIWLEVFADVVDDLRWALRHAADDDRASRARLQLALAVELYYDGDATAERRALVETGLAMARSVDDPALLAWALRAAWVASWAPEWTPDRLRYACEGVDAARAAGDPAAEAVALVGVATDRLELDGPDGWDQYRARAEEIAERDRLPYVLLTIDMIELSLAVMRRDRVAAGRRLARLQETSGDVAVPANELLPAAAQVLTQVWEPTLPTILPMLLAGTADEPLSWGSIHGMLARAGMHDELREHAAERPYSEPAPTWQTLTSFCWEAEAAYALGDRASAERSRRILAPYTGRMAVTGVAAVIGPVDGYLALALATLGDLDAARAHAVVAESLARRWRLPAYLDWLSGHRGRGGF
ncbi:BTAD domain-containing putative transcriptional regulator [Pseudonocardia tropica]|uniref:BTAD domain-containing putative transcriptional regulator n=1 Tax=Pseudonocardia tropica TaxID=681289 RepID=A0ABV1K213_9PSEU